MRASRGRARRVAPLGALAAGIGLLLIGLPWALGGRAQASYQGLLDDLLAALPPGSVVAEHYDRGWFRSQAHLELALRPGSGAGPGAPLHIRIDSRIEQGPLHWLASGLPPVLARVHSRVELVDPPVASPPFLVSTDLDLDGSGLSRIRVPAGDWPGAHTAYRLRNGELTGTLRFEPRAGALSLDLRLPVAELAAPSGPVATLEDLRLTAQLRPGPLGLKARPKSALDASGRASVMGQALAGPGDMTRRADGLTADSSQYPPGEPLDLGLELTAEAVTLGGPGYRQPRLGIAAERLDGTAIADLAAAVQVLSSGTAPQALRGLIGAALLAQVLPRLAAAQPKITVDPARVDTPEGPLIARLDLEVDRGAGSPGGPQADPARTGSWIAALRAEGQIELPESLARQWLEQSGPDTDPRPGGTAEPRPSRLQTWLDDGWFSLREGRVASAFRLAEGLLTVNGKTLPMLGLPSAGFH